MPTVLRRLLLWTIVCVVSAAPSFVVADAAFNREAMILGVCLFILAYTAVTSTDAYERFHHRPFVRRTLYIGYGLRLGLSVAFPIGMGADMLPGILSVGLVEDLGIDPHTFEGTLLTTCVQGTLLNAILFAFMWVVYAFQRAFMKHPAELRGFPVLPIDPAVPPVAAKSA